MHEVIAVVALQTAGFLSTKPDDLGRFRKHPANNFGERGTGTKDNTNTQSSKESRARSQLLSPLKTHVTELSLIHRRTQNHSNPTSANSDTLNALSFTTPQKGVSRKTGRLQAVEQSSDERISNRGS